MGFLQSVPTQQDLERALAQFESEFSSQPTEKRQSFHYRWYFGSAANVADNADNREVGLIAANDVFYCACCGDLGFAAACITPEHLDPLQRVLLAIQDDELKAVSADMIWSVRRDFSAAREAIQGYLASAQQLNANSWTHLIDRFRRALEIEKSSGGRNGPALRAIETELHKRGGDLTFCSAFLLEILYEMKMGQAASLAPLAEAAAKSAESESVPDWDRAERYWGLASQWWARARDIDKRRTSLEALAECYVRHGEAILIRPTQLLPNSHAAHWFEEAIHALRESGSSSAKKRSAELHHRLRTIQACIPSEMPLIAESVDISEGAEFAGRSVSGLPLDEALGTLAYLYNPASIKTICRQTKSAAVGAPFYFRASQVMTGPSGSTIALESPNLKTRNIELSRKREKRRVHMIQSVHMQQSFVAQGIILPALQVINDEHRFARAHLLPFLNSCAFVPPGHERLFADGIVAGAKGNWLVASHFLAPQIEAGLRGMLLALGAVPPKGEQEWGIQAFLFDEKCWNLLKLVYDESLLYDARVLLVEKFGANLRPNVTHGLLPQTTFSSPVVFYMIYLWWLTLRLCFDTLRYQASLQTSTDTIGTSTEPTIPN